MPGNATMHRYDLKWLYCNFYHPCAGYLFSISRSALSRKTARVYPHFAGLTFAHNCEEEVRSTDWHIGWRGPLLESFYLYSSPGVVQESQKSTVINTKLGWALFWSSSLPGIFVKHHWEGVLASTTAMVAKTSLLKMNSRCFKLCRVYSKEPRESVKCGRISLKMTFWGPLLG